MASEQHQQEEEEQEQQGGEGEQPAGTATAAAAAAAAPYEVAPAEQGELPPVEETTAAATEPAADGTQQQAEPQEAEPAQAQEVEQAPEQPRDGEAAKADRAWQQYLERDSSPITDLFGGQLQVGACWCDVFGAAAACTLRMLDQPVVDLETPPPPPHLPTLAGTDPACLPACWPDYA